MPIQLSGGGSSGGSSTVNSFTTIQPDAGTSPTATSSTDTLTLTSTDLTVTGNSAQKKITFTVANVGGSTAANVHTAEGLANAATNLNTVSTIVKRDGSGNFSAGTITAALTGAASLNVLKAGDTMTGPLNMPAGSASAAELTGGTANTGVFFPSSCAAAFTTAGTEIARFDGKGLLIGTTSNTLNAACVIAQNTSVDTGLILQDPSGHQWSFEIHSNTFLLEDPFSGNAYLWFNGARHATNPNWLAFGPATHGPTWPIDFNMPSNAVTNVTALSQLTPNNGSIFPPVIAMQNLNATANTIAGFVSCGSSQKPMMFVGSKHVVQTSGSESSAVIFANQMSGTLTEQFRIHTTGNLRFSGAQYTTGAGTPSLGTNCPATTLTAPNTWLQIEDASGNVLYVPAWK